MPVASSATKKSRQTAKKPATSRAQSSKKNGSLRPNFEKIQEEIAVNAYHRFVKRGGNHGNSMEDWLQAEKEIRSKYGDF